MMATNVPRLMVPFPQESRCFGRISGSRPYLLGPKKALCVLSRNTTAMSRGMLFSASPTTAVVMINSSATLVPIATERLL